MRATLIETFDEAQAFIDWLNNYRGPLAYDTETGGLKWWSDRLRLAQFGGVDEGWAIPFERWGGLVEHVLRLRAQTGDPLIMHNFSFDTKFTAHQGQLGLIQDIAIEDTRAKGFYVNNLMPTGLKPATYAYLGVDTTEPQQKLAKVMKANGFSWGDIPIDEPSYWRYGCLDTILTARLDEKLNELMTPNLRALYETELIAQRVIAQGEMAGMMLDVDYATTHQTRLLEYCDDVEVWLREQHGIETVGSSVQLGRAFQAAGWTPNKFTATGKPKLDKDILEELASSLHAPNEGVRALAEAIVEYRHARKMATSYFGNMLENRNGDAVHCSTNPIGTITGRMTVTDPALNTAPRGPLIRGAFRSRPGHKLVLIDYDQQELRITGAFSQCAALHYLFNDRPDLDVHRYTASTMYGVDYDEVGDDQRSVTKTATYAKLFMSGISTFAKSSGLEESAAADVFRRWDEAYPEVKAYSRQICDLEDRNDPDREVYIEGPTGFIHRARSRDAWKLVNHRTQGYGALVLKRALRDLHLADLAKYHRLCVHDEIIYEVPDDEVDDVVPALMDVMTDHTLSIPLTCQAVVVDNWADGKTVEPWKAAA